jgi:Uma2 family endonuclease
MPPNPPHAVIVSLLVPLLDRLLPPGWHVRSQVPSRTSDSRPEPDASIVAGRPRDYLKRHPGPAETALVIEVSDSTLDEDRGRKRRIYSRAGIPVYWIVNLVDGRVEVHTDPTGPVAEPAEPAYGSVREIGPDDSVPLVLGGRPVAEIPARDLLP